MQDNKPRAGSKISNWEWGIVIAIAAVVDIIQIILDVEVVGVLINRFIDILMGMALPTYFWFRGVNLDTKKVFTLMSSFLLEQIPAVDAMPFWTIDVVLTMLWDKADKALEKTPVVGTIVKSASKLEQKKPSASRSLNKAP